MGSQTAMLCVHLLSGSYAPDSTEASHSGNMECCVTDVLNTINFRPGHFCEKIKKQEMKICQSRNVCVCFSVWWWQLTSYCSYSCVIRFGERLKAEIQIYTNQDCHFKETTLAKIKINSINVLCHETFIINMSCLWLTNKMFLVWGRSQSSVN